MRRILMLGMAVLIVALLAVPAFAAMRVISDTFDLESGTGVAIVEVGSGLFAEINYRDMDRSQSFTPKDQRLRVKFFRRDAKPWTGSFIDSPEPVSFKP